MKSIKSNKYILYYSTAIGIILLTYPCSPVKARDPYKGSPSLTRADEVRQSAPQKNQKNLIMTNQISDDNSEQRKSFQTEAMSEETIIVTGTNIRNGGTVGAPIDTLSSVDISRSGYATINQFLQTYSQNFSGGRTEDSNDLDASNNFTEGSAPNLRGLGASATLVLVNGRRLPTAGLDASFADISTIPTSAVERIEILTEGGSAVYGTDAIAGVINIILKKDYSGQEIRTRAATVTDGGLQEYLLAPLAGYDWDSGNLIVSYEFYYREPLDNSTRSYTSSEDHRQKGGTDQREIYSNPGNILDPLTFQPVYGIPANQNGRELTIEQLILGTINLTSPIVYGQILGKQEKHSAFIYAEQNINDYFTAYIEGRYSHRRFRQQSGNSSGVIVVPESNAFFIDPFGNSDLLFVGYDFTKDLGKATNTGKTELYTATLGGSAEIVSDWQIRAYSSYNDEKSFREFGPIVDWVALDFFLASQDRATAFNPFGDGAVTDPKTIEQIKTKTSNSTSSSVWLVNFVVDGTAVTLLDRDIRFAIGLDYQNVDFKSSNRSPNIPVRKSTLGREVTSLFGEILVPVIKRDDPDGQALEISVAGRVDDYSDVGSTTNPKIGLRYQPVSNVQIRGSWGTSFRAPNLPYASESNNSYNSFTIPDPRDQSRLITVLFKSGGNKDLKNEKSDNWSFGIAWNNNSENNAYASFDYFHIKFKDRIRSLGSPLWPVTRPEQFGHLAILNPTQNQLTQFCSEKYTFNASPALCQNSSSVSALVDYRYQNFASTTVEGIDGKIGAHFLLDSVNRLLISANASYLFDFKESLGSGDRAVELVDTLGYPVDFRLRAELTWDHNQWLNISVFGNYTDSYRDLNNAPFLKVKSHLSFDLSVTAFVFNKSSNLEQPSSEISLNVVNIFNNDPPFVNSPDFAYDPDNADPLGRFIAINFTKRW